MSSWTRTRLVTCRTRTRSRKCGLVATLPHIVYEVIVSKTLAHSQNVKYLSSTIYTNTPPQITHVTSWKTTLSPVKIVTWLARDQGSFPVGTHENGVSKPILAV